MTIKTIAPGKLMVSGEWAVLEEGNACIAMAVDKYVECIIEEADHSSIQVPGAYEVHFNYEKSSLNFKRAITAAEREKLKFARAAVETFLKFMEENANPIKSFTIKTQSHDTSIIMKEAEEKSSNEPKGNEEEEEKEKAEHIKEKKLGFGSSAAACVAIGSAMMALYGYDISEKKIKDLIFKLASISHFKAQDCKGSCFDVAASTYGGVIYYKGFSRLWLKNELRANTPLLEILDGDWPHLKIKPLKLPQGLNVGCCYTSASASTTLLMMQMEKFKDKSYGLYRQIISQISETVELMRDGFETSSIKEITYMVHKNQNELKELGENSGVEIMTPELKKVIEIAVGCEVPAKVSGAGGGDCGIAVCFDEESCKKVKNAWKDAGLYPIDIKIDEKGVRKE